MGIHLIGIDPGGLLKDASGRPVILLVHENDTQIVHGIHMAGIGFKDFLIQVLGVYEAPAFLKFPCLVIEFPGIRNIHVLDNLFLYRGRHSIFFGRTFCGCFRPSRACVRRLLVIAFALVMLKQGVTLTSSLTARTPILSLPLSMIYLILPVIMGLILLVAFTQLVQDIKGVKTFYFRSDHE